MDDDKYSMTGMFYCLSCFDMSNSLAMFFSRRPKFLSLFQSSRIWAVLLLQPLYQKSVWKVWSLDTSKSASKHQKSLDRISESLSCSFLFCEMLLHQIWQLPLHCSKLPSLPIWLYHQKIYGSDTIFCRELSCNFGFPSLTSHYMSTIKSSSFLEIATKMAASSHGTV